MRSNPDISAESLADLIQEGRQLKEKLGGGLPTEETPGHRRLTVVVSEDRMFATIEAVFADTKRHEIDAALREAGIVAGICNEEIDAALATAAETGRRVTSVTCAQGTPPVCIQRMEMTFPFLEDSGLEISSPPLIHAFEDLSIETQNDFLKLTRPLVAVSEGSVLAVVGGEDEHRDGMDVLGAPILIPPGYEGPALRPGKGVKYEANQIVAENFGYVSVESGFLHVHSGLWVSPDRLTVHFLNPPRSGRLVQPTIEELRKNLDRHQIVEGIREDVIDCLIDDLSAGKIRERSILIADVRPEDRTTLNSELTFTELGADETRILIQILKSGEEPQLRKLAFFADAVSAGETLCSMKASSGKVTYLDVYGKSYSIQETANPKMRAGSNVVKVERKGAVDLVSEIYGYPIVVKNRISVITPLSISPDRMTCFYVSVPLLQTKRPTTEEMRTLLERSKIRFGLCKQGVSDVINLKKHAKNDVIVIAQGEPPVAERPSRIECYFDRVLEPGKFMDDGKVDFRERNGVPPVAKGDLIATRWIGKPGLAGTTVWGNSVKPPRTAGDVLYAGSGCQMVEENQKQDFYATLSGWARIQSGKVAVLKKFEHVGNLDYSVGNLDLEGDVEIRGDVCSGFKIKATGDIFIHGGVESGAHLSADGNVFVRNIVNKATVNAGADFAAASCQDVTVETEGNIHIKRIALDSFLRAKGMVSIQGTNKGKRQMCVVGGKIEAEGNIRLGSAGTWHGRQTLVSAGVHFEMARERDMIQKGLQFCEKQGRRLVRAIEGVIGGAIEPERVRTVLPGLAARQRALLQKLLEELRTVGAQREKLANQALAHSDTDKEIIDAKIEVRGIVFPNVKISLGEAPMNIRQELRSVVFQLKKGRVQAQEV